MRDWPQVLGGVEDFITLGSKHFLNYAYKVNDGLCAASAAANLRNSKRVCVYQDLSVQEFSLNQLETAPNSSLPEKGKQILFITNNNTLFSVVCPDDALTILCVDLGGLEITTKSIHCPISLNSCSHKNFTLLNF